MKAMPWPTALVVSVALVVLGGLAFVGADTSDLVLILVSLVGGAGVTELRGLRENTNGSQAKLLSLLEEQHKMLARIAGVTPTDQPPGPPE